MLSYLVYGDDAYAGHRHVRFKAEAAKGVQADDA
jgi:hypothetical protein